MPKDTKTLGNNKARACESLGFVHKKRLCQRFDTTSRWNDFYLMMERINIRQAGRYYIRYPYLYCIVKKGHSLVCMLVFIH